VYPNDLRVIEIEQACTQKRTRFPLAYTSKIPFNCCYILCLVENDVSNLPLGYLSLFRACVPLGEPLAGFGAMIDRPITLSNNNIRGQRTEEERKVLLFPTIDILLYQLSCQLSVHCYSPLANVGGITEKLSCCRIAPTFYFRPARGVGRRS